MNSKLTIGFKSSVSYPAIEAWPVAVRAWGKKWGRKGVILAAIYYSFRIPTGP